MQIIGFNEISKFEFCQEKSSVFGSYDYMKGKEEASSYKKLSFGMFGKSVKEAKPFTLNCIYTSRKTPGQNSPFILGSIYFPFAGRLFIFMKKRN